MSAERIADELRKMLVHPNRVWALRQLDELGLLRHIVPEVGSGQGVEVWNHTLKTLGELEGPRWPEPAPVSFPLAFGALVRWVDKRPSGVICRRLKLSNVETTRVEWLVEHSRYLGVAPTLRPSRLYPILVHPGIGDLLALHRADALASGWSLTHVEFCDRILRETPADVLNPPPLLTGDDLIALGWEQGPLFKKVLDAVREAQLDGTIATKDEAIRLAEQVRNLHKDTKDTKKDKK